jgi:hypothetical protein
MADKDKVKDQLHGALTRGGELVTEDELEAVTEVVLLVVAELAAEIALVLVDLEERVEALEAG